MKRNWEQSPRQMLHARCLTEGVRAINPGLVAGVYTEDEIMDIPTGDTEAYDQRPAAEIIQRNVTQATVNALQEKGVEPHEWEGLAKVTAGAEPKAPEEITAENYGELVVHIGKAQGEMLGKKVKDLHEKVVEWLYSKWRDRLSPMSSDQDLRLKTAVEYAYKTLKAGPERPQAASEPLPLAQDPPKESQGRTEAFNKIAAANELIERAKDLILTPATFSAFLHRQGILAEGEMIPDLSEATLQYFLSDKGWAELKKQVEADGKPTVVDKPKPRRGRRRK